MAAAGQPSAVLRGLPGQDRAADPHGGADPGQLSSRAYRYRIDASTDGVYWTEVVDRTSNTSASSLVDDFRNVPIALRYAKLTVTGVYGAAITWLSIVLSVAATTWTTAARLTLPDTAEPQLVLLPVLRARWIRLNVASAYGTSGVGIAEFAVRQP